jgi:SAM-dependent methyltransferase
MPSDRLDLTQRADPATLPEWMDEPCSYEDLRACLVDLAQANRLTLAARPTIAFLNALHRQAQPLRGQPLKILDVGCGGGDMLRRIERWAARRQIAVSLTGIDLNPYAARAAAEFTPPTSRIRYLTGDAYSFSEPVDIILSSLLMHHLTDVELTAFLSWMEHTAQRGWFVNDLVREATPMRLFQALARLLRWHSFVRHDGPVSFRRALREEDWARLITAAGLDPATIALARHTPGRLCVSRMK